MNSGVGDDEVWDAVRAALVTSSIEQESREDVLGIAAAEVALMRLADRGRRSSRVTVRVDGEVLRGVVRVWTEELVVLEGGVDAWAVRVGAIDAITDMPRALHTEPMEGATARAILDEWTGDDVEVWTRSGRYRGHLVVASDHLEIAGTTVIPWVSVLAVHRRN
ncbi:MAG: hypothetical protein ACKOBJ_01855 [Actinomycetota bacterium]